MTAFVRNLIAAPANNLDLIGVFVVIACVSNLVPTDSLVARPDLAPWITVMVIVVALLRGKTLGDAPPPGLTPMVWGLGNWMLRIGRVLAPVTVFAAYDAGATLSGTWLWATLGLAIGTVVLRGVGMAHGRTAWSPSGGGSVVVWALRALIVVAAAFGAGLIHRFVYESFVVWLPISTFVGLQFLTVGLFDDRLRTRRQRAATGRRDGRPYRPSRFRYVLAAFGPSSGLLLLLWLHELFIGSADFAQASVISLHVFAWAAVLFPKRSPIAVSCLLHEVVPAGGRDRGAKPGQVVSFDQPPEGALRIDPVQVRRLRVIHHWVVQVRDPRIEDLDDPIRPLWPRRPIPLSNHVLGDASFEPDAVTQQPQWRSITVRLKNQVDVDQIHEFNAQQRRMVVLRPFSSLMDSLFRTGRTYQWDKALPRNAMSVVDASTTELTLRDGDVLILSTEGVARAFELEIGSPVYDRAAFGHQRPPQLEDYVVIG